VFAQRLDECLDGFQAAPVRAAAPAAQVLGGGVSLLVLPEKAERLFPVIGPDGLEAAPVDDLLQPFALFVGQVLRALQEGVAQILEDREPLTRKLRRLGPPDLVDGLVELGLDVEAVEDVHGVGKQFGRGLQVRPPHVAAHMPDVRAPGPAPLLQDAGERALLAPPGDEEKARLRRAELVDEGLVFALDTEVDLVDADGGDPGQVTVFQPPVHGLADGLAHLVPAAAENPGNLVPGEPLRPTRQEPSVRLRQRALAIRPRDLLRARPARRAVRPPRRVHQHHLQHAQRHAPVTARRQVVVHRAAPPAPGARHPRPGPLTDQHLQHVGIPVQLASLVNKALVVFHVV